MARPMFSFIAERAHDKFYSWFGRTYPERNSLIEDGFSRRHMRDAYEAGFRAGRMDEKDLRFKAGGKRTSTSTRGEIK